MYLNIYFSKEDRWITNEPMGTSLAVQWLRICLPMQGVWVRSLVGELRSHMPHGQKNQNIKQKQYCNKFNKDFKNCPHQKKKNLKKQNKTNKHVKDAQRY